MEDRTHDKRLAELEATFFEHERNYRSFKNLLEETNKKTTDLHNFLMGGKYDDRLNGGFIRYIQNAVEKLDTLARWRDKLIGGWIILTAITGSALTLLVFRWGTIKQTLINDILVRVMEELERII